MIIVVVPIIQSSATAKPMEKRSETSYLIKNVPTESFWEKDNVMEVTGGKSNLEELINENYSNKLEEILLAYGTEKEKHRQSLRDYQTSNSFVTSSNTISSNLMSWIELVEAEKVEVELLFDLWEEELSRNNLSTDRVMEYREERRGMR